MTKLHELLAVEGKLEGQTKKVTSDLAKTFTSKRHLFEEKLTVFKPFGEGEKESVESQSDIQTTINGELSLLQNFFRQSLDASFQVAEANTKARADIVLEDGTVLAKDVPATSLLELEKRVAEISELLKSVPTLDPAKGFTPDPDHGADVFQARPVVKNRTKKVQKPIVLYDATPEHPAQTQIVVEDEAVGQLHEQEWSGLITPSEKSAMINRSEELGRAVRQARSRANEQEVSEAKIAKNLLGHIFK